MAVLNVDSLRALLKLKTIQTESRNAVRQGNEFVNLVSVRDNPPTAESVLLLCTEGPRGVVVNCQPTAGGKWSIVARYPATRVVEWTRAKIAEFVQ